MRARIAMSAAITPDMKRPEPGHAVYRGRFAPSPTGALHFGSLVAAVASYLDARAHAGEWILRIEDLDRQREIPGAADSMLHTLDGFGFAWDGQVIRQRLRTDAYTEAVKGLKQRGLIYPCGCSRREIAAMARTGPEGPIYPGTCRSGLAHGRGARSLRMRTDPGTLTLSDRIQGSLKQDIHREIGDFVIRRADGVHAYQLAVVVDDAWQGITHIVRGADLILSTPRQILLQHCLGLPTPSYAHVPLAVDRDGHKLSKSIDSLPVDPANPIPALLFAWNFLDQAAFPYRPASTDEFWKKALDLWDLSSIQPVPAKAIHSSVIDD